MSSNFGFTSFSNLGDLVEQVQQVASQVSNQFNQIDNGIQDVASNIEHAFAGSRSATRSTDDNTPNKESNNTLSPNYSSCDSSSSNQSAGIPPTSSQTSKKRKTKLEGDGLRGESTEINSSSTSATSAPLPEASQATTPDLEDDFVYVDKVSMLEGQ